MRPVGEGQRLRVLGVPVDAVGLSDTLAWVEKRVASREPGAHVCVNAANVVRAHDDSDYLALLERADLIGADGQPLVWGARLLGQRLPERVTGIDLMERVLTRARESRWRVYLLGGRDHVVTRLADRLAAEGLEIVGRQHGYFDSRDEDRIVSDLRGCEPDVLFVGMPTPVKERFIIDRASAAGVPVSIGVGGSFDVLAGELRRAPRLLQRCGLEWLFRLAQEPRRLFGRYAVTNTKFVALLVVAMLRRARQPRR